MNTLAQQRGASLIEGLIALVVLSLSLVATLRMQTWLRHHSDLARERSEAVQHAQQALEAQRGFRDFAAFDHPAPLEPAIEGRSTTYRPQLDSAMVDGLRTERATVRWQHRREGEETLQLASSIARLAPVYSGLLDVPPQDRVLALQRPLPATAHALADGRRIVRPTSDSRTAWVLNAVTGEIEQQCAVAASSQARDLRAEDLSRCEPFNARLVRGFVRFSLSTTPDPLHANDPPLPLTVQAGGQRCDSETIAADGERYIAYACAVPVGAPRDNDPTLVPQGWSFGLTASAFRSCRYPAAAQAPRNYLVVRGDIACPSVDPQHNGVPVATVQHQP